MLPLIAFVVLCTPALTDVFKVAPAGLGTHTDIQAAIDAAADGDIILVDSSVPFSGTPTSAVVDGFGLTIIGDGATRAEMPVTIVENLPAGSAVILRNLDFQSTPVDEQVGGVLAIQDCDGTVLVEDCTIEGRDSPPVDSGKGGPGMFIGNAAGVSIVRSTVSGGDGSSAMSVPLVIFPGHGSRALRIVASSVSLHGTTVRGGDGGDDENLFQRGGGGGLGLDTMNAKLWTIGSTVIGGEGGIGTPPGTSSMGAQLDGFPAGSPSLREVDTMFLGGSGMPGLVVVAGTHTVAPGDAVDFVFPSPLRPSDTADMVITGPPNTTFGLFLSLGAGFLPKNNFNGVFVIGLSTFVGPVLITLPPSGTLTVPLTAAAVGGLNGFVLVNQGVSVQPGSGMVLSNASSWVQIENGL